MSTILFSLQNSKQSDIDYETKFNELSMDQENLLALLQDVESKYKKYRQVLKHTYGFTDFDEDDDDEDDIDDSESAKSYEN